MPPRLALAAIVIAALLAACAGGPATSGIPRSPIAGPDASAPQPSARPTETPAPEPTRVPTPAPPLPSIAPGITPATDRVVMRVSVVGDMAGPAAPVPVTVYADGSIVHPSIERFHGPGVRRLSGSGLERLLAQARASGLFAESRTIAPLVLPNSGFSTYTVELRDGGRITTVETINANPTVEGRRLIDLAESVLKPAEPADPDDWVDGSAALQPYRARTTRLTAELVAFAPGGWRRPAVDVGRVAWPLAGSPVDVGDPVAIPDGPTRAVRCALVTGADEARIRLVLETAGAEPSEAVPDVLSRAWDLSVPTVPGILRLSVRPFLPEESPGCTSVPFPEAPVPEPPPPPSFGAFWTVARAGTPDGGGRLVRVEVFRAGPGGGPVATLEYLDDGSILVLDPPPPAVGVGIRSLSPAGLERLEAMLASPGLQGDDIEERPPAGVRTFTSYRVEGLLGAMWRVVSVTDWRPSTEAATLIALAKTLAAPDTWGGSDGWRDGDASVYPWRPDRVELRVERYEDPAAVDLPPASLVRWPLEGGLESLRCDLLGFEEADAVVTAFAAAGLDEEAGGTLGAEYRLRSSEPDTQVQVRLTVLLPSEEASCAATGS